MKSITKRKKAAMNRERGTTGGGPCKNILLKSSEEEIERLISNTEAFGDEAVEESTAEFVFEETPQRHIVDSFLNVEEETYFLHIDDLGKTDHFAAMNDSSKESRTSSNTGPRANEKPTSYSSTEYAGSIAAMTSSTKEPRASSNTGLRANERPTSCSSTGLEESSTQKEKLQKVVANKRRRKLSVPAQRLRKSISEATKSVDVSSSEYELKKKYYERKLEIYERIAVSMERVALAIQQFAAVPEADYPVEYLDEEI